MRGLWLLTLVASAAAGADKLEVRPDKALLTVGESAQFNVLLGGKPVPAKDLKVTVAPATIGSWKTQDSFDTQKMEFTVREKLDAGITAAELTLTFEHTPQGGEPMKAEAVVEVMSARRDQWESRAVAGYHQAGASSANFTQNFFFDFFIMRGLGNHEKLYDSRFNLWGNVRVASSPQQTTTGEQAISEFAANFATTAGKVKVNELAQSAEFQAGLDLRLGKKAWRQGNRVRLPSFIAYFGATGNFTEPSVRGQVFKVPGSDSAQSTLFKSRYPNVTTEYVGFVPPDRERFYHMWGAGFRLTSFDKDARYAPPATFLLAFGQDEMITGGALKGVVSRIDVFYPLPAKDPDGRFKCLFLFGTVNLRLSRAGIETPLILEPASADIKLYNPGVSIVTVASTRDTYRIGVGIDFVNLWNSWIKPKQPAETK
jgi:hypothetical protein